jgi:hypothetical protein
MPHLKYLPPAFMDDIAWPIELHKYNLVALTLAPQYYRILLAKDIVAGVDKDREFKGASAVVADVEVDYFLGEGVGDFGEAGLVEGQAVPHLYAFWTVCYVDLVRKDVRAEGEELVGVVAVEEEVVLAAVGQLGVLRGDVGLNIERVLQIVQTFSIALDSNIDHLDTRVHQQFQPTIPRKGDLRCII